LQRSNTKHVSGITALIHGVDSEKLLDELEKRASQMSITLNVLLQVHIAQEETKHGFAAEEVGALISHSHAPVRWPHATIRGLMGMGTNTNDRAVVRAEFRGLAALFRSLQPQAGDHFHVLSMGMSDDADLAVAEGSTLVRIGTAIFGPRA